MGLRGAGLKLFMVSIDDLEDTGLGGGKWGKLYWHKKIFLVQKNIGQDQT